MNHSLEDSAAPICDAQGCLLGIILVFRDITARRQAEAASLRLAAIVESSDDAIISKSLDGVVNSWNVAAERIFGYRAEEMIGQPILRLLPEDRKEEERLILERLRRGERVDHFETVRRTKEGRLLDVSVTISPLRDEHGTITGASKIARDITERKQAEEALAQRTAALQRSQEAERTQREYFQVTLASIGDAVIVTDPQGEITFLNRVAEAVTGWTTAEAAGKPLPEVFRIQHEETRQLVENPVTKVLRTGGIVGLTNHTILIRKDGSLSPIEDSAAPIRDEQGRLLGIILVFRDITERRQTEEAQVQLLGELQRANEELQQFAYIISHDLNEPLRTMSSFVSLLACQYQGKLDKTADEYLGFVTDGSQRMQGMITDLLAYTRAGGQDLTLAPVDSEKLLARVLTDLQMAIAEAKAEISYDSLPTVQGDATRLGQVLQNLIGNALKFRGQAPPQIHVSAVKEGRYWQFSIRDNGIGIDPHQAERIFRAFQRLHTPGEYPGTGMGLAICKKIVERHGGRIWVEPKPGEGSSFHFTIQDRL